MKNSLTYGFVLALGGAILAMALFFFGFYDTPEKMESSRLISMVVGTAISILVITMGVKDKRDLTPADKPWGYGSAFGTGFMIGLVGAILGAVFQYVFFAYINPGAQEVIWQAQRAAFEAKGMAAEQIDQIEPMVRKWTSPVMMAVFGFGGGLLFSTIFSLIIGAFTKNRPEQASA
jgi:hypothetical protein